MKDKRDKKPRDIKLIEVTTVQGPVEAEVTKSFLESCGITAFLKGLVVQSVHAFSADGLLLSRPIKPLVIFREGWCAC